MKQFKDEKKKVWDVAVDIGQIETVRDRVSVDLYSLFADEAKRLFADPVLLVKTLYVLCEKQADERQMSAQDFADGFDGDALEDGANALLEEMLRFFPTSRKRILRATVDKSKDLAAQMEEKALTAIAGLSVTDLLKPGVSPALSA